MVTADTTAKTLAATISDSTAKRNLNRLLTEPAHLEFRHVSQLDSSWLTRPVSVRGRNTGIEEMLAPNGRAVPPSTIAKVLARPAPFTSADLKPTCRVEQMSAGVVIHFELNDSRKTQFEEFTKRLIGKRLAVFLDRRLLMAPTVNAPIPGRGIIEVRDSLEDANTLAIQLNSGSLPVPLEIVGRKSAK